MLVGGFDLVNIIRIGVDITIVWYVLYKLIMIIRGTKAIQLLKGIVVVIIVWLLSILFDLQTIQWITNQAILWGFLVIIILFQPELRRALEQLGRGSIFSRGTKSEEEVIDQIIKSIVTSSLYMAKRRIGALITIELDTGVGEYAETGIPINGELTNQLLTNIFTPNTPLHDGAVILKDSKIVAAACYLPLSESASISRDLGTRHRAALGISEVTDALTIVVSEETGAISCSKNGELFRDLDEEKLHDILMRNLTQTIKGPDVNPLNWRAKKNG
ncbi:diadenylate cyclase CdaA [Pseudogracilibacillus auburnensis]|uniref:Diadenylate cyclase n=1 Tax=Pseudogracilibacillus auburnensis TaxID=1494959 RepID=A0A2V3VY77_9BACI|nr:diadenylate cyclase CdaA [Pseudogracilibacillus auburnensis]MBO1004042.1 TIGR00159 family protein [Pseudogracilibacillus auburnensis]PXW85668.1 diadenylate cyclase [Pseudogracilibacillus auburnensis]